MLLNERRAICDCTLKGVSVVCRQSWPFWIPWSCIWTNELLGNSSDLLQNWSVHLNNVAEWTACYLWLYVEGCVRGVPSKLAVFHGIFSLFRLVFERTPPRGVVAWASKFFSTLTRCNLRTVVLIATLRQRAWPWRAVKVGHFEWNFTFSHCIWTNSS